MSQRRSTDRDEAVLAWPACDGAWYEQQQLSQAERRQRGHYSTPPNLVAWMLDALGYRAERHLEHLTLLDPSCGSGNFLAAAIERLMARGRALGWPAWRILAALQTNLWGLESDPIACALADLRLQGLARPLAAKARLQFHIHQADALALSAAPRFQFVVGNPPYLSSRKSDLEAYRQDYLSGGQRDAYLLFLEQACRLVVPGGWLGLVLPDPLLARANAADARRLLQESLTLRRLLHLEGVFRAEVGTVVLLAERVPAPASMIVSWSRFDWRKAAEQDHQQAEASSGILAGALWRQQPRAELRYLLGPEEVSLFERLAREVPSAPLGDLVMLSRGEELARGAVQPLSAEEARAANGDLLPALRGGLDVLPFRCRFAGVSLLRSQVVKPLERYLRPKLLVVKSTARLLAALDEDGSIALQTLYLLHPNSAQVLPEYLLALLNSRLLRGYVWLYHTAYKLVQPQIEQEALARVPVPLLPLPQQQELAALAGDLRVLYREQDRWGQEWAPAVLTQSNGEVAPTPAHRRSTPPQRRIHSALGAYRQEVPPGLTDQPRRGFVAPQGARSADFNRGMAGACTHEAAWVQLQQGIRDLLARLDSALASYCGLRDEEQALLERLQIPGDRRGP